MYITNTVPGSYVLQGTTYLMIVRPSFKCLGFHWDTLGPSKLDNQYSIWYHNMHGRRQRCTTTPWGLASSDATSSVPLSKISYKVRVVWSMSSCSLMIVPTQEPSRPTTLTTSVIDTWCCRWEGEGKGKEVKGWETVLWVGCERVWKEIKISVCWQVLLLVLLLALAKPGGGQLRFQTVSILPKRHSILQE